MLSSYSFKYFHIIMEESSRVGTQMYVIENRSKRALIGDWLEERGGVRTKRFNDTKGTKIGCCMD